MLELSQRHLGEANIAVYGGYANNLFFASQKPVAKRIIEDIFEKHRSPG
jgi:hypothetical protein